jgi:hypothetical protein
MTFVPLPIPLSGTHIYPSSRNPQKSSNKLYFARDPIGRRSLLLHKPTLSEPWFLLSSVSPKGKEPNDGIEWEEVGVEGVWYAGLAGVKVDRDSTIRLRGFTDFGQQGSEDVVINYEPRVSLLPRRRFLLYSRSNSTFIACSPSSKPCPSPISDNLNSYDHAAGDHLAIHSNIIGQRSCESN